MGRCSAARGPQRKLKLTVQSRSRPPKKRGWQWLRHEIQALLTLCSKTATILGLRANNQAQTNKNKTKQNKQTNKHTNTQTHKQTNEQANERTDEQASKQTRTTKHKQTKTTQNTTNQHKTHKQTNTQTHKQTNKQANERTSKQASKHANMHVIKVFASLCVQGGGRPMKKSRQ